MSMILSKEELLNSLRNRTVRVTFTKVDGTTRVMNATLNKEFIEEKNLVPKGGLLEQKTKDTVIKVVDTDINEWRSIKFDNIIEVM